MFNLRKRASFSTVGELEELLRELPRNTPVTICGDSRCYYHEELDRSVICLDCEDLEENYKEAAEYETADRPLLPFLREEVACRLSERMELPDYLISDQLIEECVSELTENSEQIFHSDRIDELLMTVLKRRGIDTEEGEPC